MSKASRRRYIADALRDTRSVARNLATAERHLEERSAGIRGTSYDGRSGPARHDPLDEEFGRATIADPTGDAGVNPDACRAAEQRLDRAAKAFARAAASLRACVDQAIAVAAPTAEELAQLEAKAEPGCEVVGRIPRGDGLPNHWEPVHRTTDIEGLLPRPYSLGRWAYDFARRNGRLPSEREATLHVEGRTVMVPA